MKRLRFLGIGSNSLENLDTTSLLFDLADGTHMLVDCGPNTPRKVLESGAKLRDVRLLVVTHSHMDHALGVPYLLFGRNLEVQAAIKQDPTYAPLALEVVCETALWQTCCEILRSLHPEVKLAFDVHHHEIDDFQNSGFEVMPEVDLRSVEADHAVKTYGLVLHANGKKIVAYSSDTLPTAAFVNAARGAWILIHEGMVPKTEAGFSAATKHATAEQAGEVIAAVGPTAAYMVHLRPAFYDNRNALEEEASRAAGMLVTYPAEGAIVELGV